MTTYRTLPDGNILVHVPMRLVRKQSGVRLLATEALALGLKYRRVALTDEFPSRFKMAQHYGFDSSYLTRMIRLGYLSPVIVEKMARGELAHVTIQRLQQIQTPVWAEQHRELGIE